MSENYSQIAIFSKWQTQDKQWLKDRRSKWKLAKKVLDDSLFLSNPPGTYSQTEFTNIVKDYYLFGKIDESCDFSKVWGGLFFKVFLHPINDKETWKALLDKEDSSRITSERIFLKQVLGYKSDKPYPPLEEKEEQIYDLFYETRLLRENHLDLTDEEWKLLLQREFTHETRNISCMFGWPVENPRYLHMLKFDYWYDCYIEGYVFCRGFAVLVDDVGRVLKNRSKYKDFIVEHAIKYEEAFFSEKAPQEAVEKIHEMRNMTEKEFFRFQMKLEWYPGEGKKKKPKLP